MKNEQMCGRFLSPISQQTPNRVEIMDIRPAKAANHCHHNTIPEEDTKFRQVYTANGKASYTRTYQDKPICPQIKSQKRDGSCIRGIEGILNIQRRIHLPRGYFIEPEKYGGEGQRKGSEKEKVRGQSIESKK